VKKALILMVTVFLASCASQQTPIPEAENREARLYAAKCATCHSLPHPKRNSYAQWEHLIGVMEEHMKHKEMAPLGPDERSGILEYLKKHSR